MYVYFLAGVLLLSNVAMSSEACNVKNIKDFYNRIELNGPLQVEAIKKKELASSKIDIAQQKPNPEIDFEYLKGDEFGLDINTYSLSAKHTIELGSKRDKRIEKAKSYQKLKGAEVDLALFNSNVQAAINYQRVAQLGVTIEAVKEAIHTFENLIKKLSLRKRLNPEETVSLSTLKLASNDYKAQLNDLENEKTLLMGRIKFLSKCNDLVPRYQYLKYQDITLLNEENEKKGLLKLEDFKVDLAKGELEVERSMGYSNISIGPTFEYQTQGNDEFISAGVSVSFALPIFHTNDGGKLNALKSLSTQKILSANKKEMLKIERKNLVQKFQRSLRTLQGMPSLTELEEKHQEVEKLFSRGVVSIQMSIESHRQQIDFLRSKFETENDILDTYGKLILIDGNTKAFEGLF
jgi:cobalt-zinc-cadmium efflux system outer membrane protein